MCYDKRAALKNDSTLTIKDENNGNSYTFLVKKEIARGGSCIVYEGINTIEVGSAPAVEQNIIIKEFYPRALEEGIERDKDNNNLCVAPDAEEAFEKRLQHFCEGQAKHVAFANNHFTNAFPAASFSGRAHGTIYTISTKVPGDILSKVGREKLTLKDVLEISASICDAISQVHDGLKIYLDCKPDNIGILDKRVYLFDFDTAQDQNALRFSSFSPGWSAPEQEQRNEMGYINTAMIGYHTDIYSIGLVVYYLLTGSSSLKGRPDIGSEGTDWEAAINLLDETNALKDKTFASELNRIMRSMLEEDAKKRKKEYPQSDAAVKLKHEFEYLLRLAGNAPIKELSNKVDMLLSKEKQRKVDYSFRKAGATNRFLYGAEASEFSGRETEVQYFLKMCLEDDAQFCWTGICGDGGAGKSRLAYEVCKIMEKKGWTVFAPSHARITAKKIEEALSSIEKDTLICFDDANADMDIITDFMYYCAEAPINIKHKVRIIVIDRDLSNIYFDYSSVFIYMYLDNNPDKKLDFSEGFLYLKMLNEKEKRKIIKSYASKEYHKEITEDEVTILCEAIKSVDALERPLFILFLCDAWCNGNDVRDWDRKDALEIVVNKEYERALELIRSEYKKKSEQMNALHAIQRVLTISSFIGGIEKDQLNNLLGTYASIADDSFLWIIEQLGLLYGELINVDNYPDLVSEFISLSYIKSLTAKQANEIFTVIFLNANRRTMQFGRALCIDYYDMMVAPSNMSILQFAVAKATLRIAKEDMDSFTNAQRDTIEKAVEKLNEVKFKKDIDDILCFLQKNPDKLFCLRDPDIFDLVSDKKAYARFKKDMLSYFEKNPGARSVPVDLSDVVPSYKGEILLSWRCGRGTQKYEDGSIYEGEWNFDAPSGEGTITWKDGRTYSGGWKNGKQQGHGVYSNKDNENEQYEGDFFDNRYNGMGTYVRGRFTYYGFWKDGKKHGRGVYITSSEKEKYDKRILEDAFKGTEALIVPNADAYIGDFRDDRFNGLGIYTMDGGKRIYIGEFKNGRFNGKGTLRENSTWTRGNYTYVGEFRDDRFNGLGTFSRGDGCIWKGNFVDGRPNGHVDYTDAFTGEKYVGEMRDWMRDGFGTHTRKDGSVYEGEFRDDQYNGMGTMKMSDGSVYKGSWKDGMRNGHGIYTEKNTTEKFVGEWYNDKRYGIGYLFYETGKIKVGFWEDDQLKEIVTEL